MEEAFGRIYVLLMLAMFVVALTLHTGPVFWAIVAAEGVTFASWAAWAWRHRNDYPEEEE